MVPRPPEGRVFSGRHRVRLADVTPHGRMRLDGLARHLQDVAADDSRDAALTGAEFWVVRRTRMVIHRFPQYQQLLDVHTWCGGLGSHWAERRTSLADATSGDLLVDTATLWVKIDPDSMRPARVGTEFLDLYAAAAGGRTVSAKLSHDDPDDDAQSAPWPLRFADFDALGHVNNAVGWEPVEEFLASRQALRPTDDAVLVAEVEHRSAIERGADLRVVVDGDIDATTLGVWLVDRATSPATVALSARVGIVQPTSE